ncbi:hypothetical protein F183_A16650 [Bryobacterales bacterium F-183]|nr:hypothetical protein F183_A16650 [Bryobacterales bacterium F-183]
MKLFPVVIASCCVSVAVAGNLPELIAESGALKGRKEFVKPVKAGETISVHFAVKPAGPALFTVEGKAGEVLAAKRLHTGDGDYTTLVSAPAGGSMRFVVQGSTGSYELKATRWPGSALLKREPNNTWRQANVVPLGSVVFASADENPYIPIPETPKPKDPMGEQDWYKFEFRDTKPKLVYFQIELMERDHLPVDVSVHRVGADGKIAPYFEGEDPVALPHEVQALPGNKFTTRVLKEAGTYYVCVRANHPEYKLRTRVYDVPPYAKPEDAVRAAVDFAMGAGDSWHANTPRRGGIYDRVSSLHQETSLCVACHATHFTQRAQMYATRNGYPVVQRQQLQFMTERFYNNPRPFYGFEKEGAVWSRMISAAANVLSRMSTLLGIYETEIAGEQRASFHNGVNEYLKLYYAGRDKLPSDETNGNTPLVSAHEVAWYSWVASKDPRLPEFVAKGEVKNTIDLCYQTLALADMDRAKYKEKIAANAERILSLQRPSGQWAAKFGEKELETEFQTGHALWALHAAGIPREHPKVAKGLQYLLKRQQEFGGWMDPIQAYENFRTPFRETQMSVLALSAYYPGPGKGGRWSATPVAALSSNPAEMLQQLDQYWVGGADLTAAAGSNDPYVRQAAVEAMGRIADPASLQLLIVRLGDSSKLVRRTAAWAVRQAYSRHPGLATTPLEQALTKGDERTRWGATRVFAQHFAGLASRPGLDTALIEASKAAEPAIRTQALKGLWQMWFWNADPASRSRIEDTFLAQIEKPQHAWVNRNLTEGIYNIADENIRYFYNNWIPLLGRDEDKVRVIKGRLAVESRLADKFAKVLEGNNDYQRKTLLAALGDFELRHADVYEPLNKVEDTFPPQYNRIGNDVEQIAFFGQSAERFSKALLPLLSSPDATMKKLAQTAGLMVRPTRFPGVIEVAGELGPLSKQVEASLPKPPPPPPMPAGATTVTKNTRKLDETYFRGYVQPILEKRGRDGYACVHCHASHAIFDGSWSTARKVVNVDNPEESLILRKPTSSAEQEGVVDSKVLAHGGGVRWTKNSPEYMTILEWIKGAVE